MHGNKHATLLVLESRGKQGFAKLTVVRVLRETSVAAGDLA
jgi:hypothetical protein